MAELNPFRALRYTTKAGNPTSLICPPYDKISEPQYQALTAASPFNAVRLELPDDDGGAEVLLSEWLENGILKQETLPGFYICEQEFVRLGQTRKSKGFLCQVKIEDETVIFPHQECVSSDVEERFQLLKNTFCECSPVCALYDDDEKKTMTRINALSAGKPRFEFLSDGVTYRLWGVNDILVIREICADFMKRKLWIADGHSHYASAAQLRGCDGSVFMLLTDLAQDGLTVLPFHCLLKDSESFDEAKFLSDCEPYFQVISRETMPQCIADEMERYLDALYRQGKKAFGFYSGGESWTLLILKEIAVMDELLPEKSASFRALDGSILHSLILERLLGLKNDAAQSKTDYTTSMEKAVSSVQSGFSKCAFLLNPARLKEICEVADAGEKMPPKSTCFYPAIPAGMVINLSKDES